MVLAQLVSVSFAVALFQLALAFRDLPDGTLLQSAALRNGIDKQLGATNSAEVDMLNWMGRAALELIGQGGLGYSFDPLVENKENDFGDAIKQLV